MPADLHIHSSLSDGTYTPEEIVAMAGRSGLTKISITDHDLTDGIERAEKAGREAGVEVIPGVEFTTDSPGIEIHILGYFIDYRNQEFSEALKQIQADRVRRIYKIVDKLKEINIPIEADEVFALSGKIAPGRPHVAKVLINKGIVSSFKEAFIRFLDTRGPAYVPHFKLLPKDTIHLIAKVGGVAVFAHPAVSNCDALIPALMAEGLKGIEVYYGGYRPDQIEHYRELANKYGLLMTGGSDFHGENSGRESKLGELTIPDELVEKLRDEHLHRN